MAHCLLVEAGDGFVLVDTGFGTEDVANPKRLGQPFRAMVRPECRADEPAIRQIERTGPRPRATCGISRSRTSTWITPAASATFRTRQVHVFKPELEAPRNPPLRERARYIKAQWAHGPKWAEHEVEGDSWFGSRASACCPDLPVEIVLVPLVGHSTGHSAIAVNTPDGWVMHCGDAYFLHTEVATPRVLPGRPAGLPEHRGARREGAAGQPGAPAELAREHGDEVKLICSHDPIYMPGG